MPEQPKPTPPITAEDARTMDDIAQALAAAAKRK